MKNKQWYTLERGAFYDVLPNFSKKGKHESSVVISYNEM